MGMKSGVLPIALGFLLSLVPLARADDSTTAPAKQKAVIIQLQGEVDDYNADELTRRFDEARKLGANVVILNLDTYGGLVTSGLDISRFIKRQTDLHTIAFVEDKAISAGAMIAMACDEIVVSGSASIGDCAPIVFGDEGELEAMPPAERAKAESPVLLDFDESAHRNHHDPLLAAAMVDVTRVVYWVQDKQGNRKFVDDKEYADLMKTGNWIDVPGAKVPVDGPTTLLVVDSDEALQYGLATGQAASATALADQRGYDLVADLTPGWGENLVEILSGGIARGLLIIIFLQCLYIVLHAPGHGAAETVGLIALGLMLGVPLLTGYGTWWEILMVFVGLTLISFEILLPGHIFPGISGLILLVFGLILTFIPKAPTGAPTIFEDPHLAWVSAQRGVYIVAAALGSSLFLWFWLNRFLPKMPVLNRLIITATSGNSPATLLSHSTAGSSSLWPPIGAIGKAATELKPGGSAEFFDPELSGSRVASVVSESGYIPLGTEIVVRTVDGPTVIVRKRA